MKIRNVIKAFALLIITIIFSNIPVFASSYSDVPSNHWSSPILEEASSKGIVSGHEDGTFGLSNNVKRSEFATMLVRVMKWDKSTSSNSQFSDVQNTDWYFSDVNTLKEHNIFNETYFRPNDNITRMEMTIMLIKALGYEELAKSDKSNIFSDVTNNSGYVSVAYSLGIVSGKSETIFDPNGLALREESVAMLVRVYNKYYAPLDKIHGFYAISSWDQREVAKEMETVSFGWGRLEYTDEKIVLLNQTRTNNNDWFLPNGYNDAILYMRTNNIPINLAITMTDNDDAKAILLNDENRKLAISQIVLASKDFDGVTIDFEGMKGDSLKNGFNEFIKELRNNLGIKKLYIAVHPVLENSNEYFDAYDYKTLGEYADKIILMAHDYAPTSLPEHLLNTDYIATPVSPFNEVYYALKVITDSETGVMDKSKIQLAISTPSSIAFNTENKKIINSMPIYPSIETVQKRLAQEGTEINYSKLYKNPYAFYNTEEGQQVLIWYEDSRSINDKINLAKMFGINEISIWRIGAIPNGNTEQHMDIWDEILLNK